MEHSYMRDVRQLESSQTAKTRTLMVHRPPQCPSCHSHADERIDLEESYNPPIPSYNEESARKAMQESENIIAAARKALPDDEDWEERVNKFGWSVQQFKLFDRVARLLDMDRLARLTNTDKQHEPVHRRTVIDKSVSRLRQALANVSWETRLTQWLHSLLVENLPPSYLAIYVDILQTLQANLPDLVNKMIFCHPQNNVGQELLGTILKKPWEPIVANKNRKLPGQPYIIVVPSGPYFAQPSARMQKWYNLFSTMASVIPIPGPTVDVTTSKQTLQSLAERMVAETREKIQEIRKPAPNRPIILVGFNAGAAHAIQIGLVETVSCVVCLGFSYHTYNGPRGAPNDHIVDITSPVLFVVGQNSARASHEEIEMLRDRMIAQTSLVVVGSADECLRVSKTKRKIEGVTQSMTDNMVADEIADFATSCLVNPQGHRKSAQGDLKLNGPLTNSNVGINSNIITLTSNYREVKDSADALNQRKRKQPPPSPALQTISDAKYGMVSSSKQPKKMQLIKPSRVPKGTISLAVSTSQSQEALDMAIQSILPTTPEKPSTIVGGKVSEPFNRNVSRSDSAASLGTKKDVQVVSGLASTPLMLPRLKRDISSTTHGTLLDGQAQSGNMNVKLIASNQLIQLKPSAGTTQKFYSLQSTTTKPVVSVISGSPGSDESPQTASPSKFMIIRSTGQVITSSGDTPTSSKPASGDLTGTNIFDMPIVFADNDGFIDESAPSKVKEGGTSKASANKATVTSDQMIVANPSTIPVVASETVVKTTPQLTGNRFVTLQPASTTTGKTNKIVLINSIKPVDGSILLPGNINLSNVSNVSAASSSGANQGGVKYTKVVLTAGKAGTPLSKNISQLLSSGKVEIMNNSTVKQPSTSTPVTLQQGKFIINTSKTISNIPTSTSAAGTTSTAKGQIIGGNKILIKTTGGGTTTAAGIPSLVGRNVTLKRLNIISSSPATKPTTTTTTATAQKEKMLAVRPAIGCGLVTRLAPVALSGMMKSPTTNVISRPFWGWVNMMFNRVDRARLKKVGPDRLCAEWLLKNGAKAKFVKDSRTHVHFNALPEEALPVLMEELDGTDSGIMHIGFDHLEGLTRLRKVVLHNCVYIDNHALAKLRLAAHSLEEVQVSKCGNVTDAGLLELKNLPKLQQVTTFELPDVKDLKQVEQQLRSALPSCKFDMKP
ncbi:testis development protein prtd [Anopheles darlingi]|uniref:Testis development protein prtd n=1 Tax=Anopheles darlingi TaxID=43151 RepID=W5JBN3_ANODA|nr:testis development protein prtd [Anopheles darlingi]